MINFSLGHNDFKSSAAEVSESIYMWERVKNKMGSRSERFKIVFHRAIYHMTMLAVPHLIQTKGCIVNVSSVNGIRSVSVYT